MNCQSPQYISRTEMDYCEGDSHISFKNFVAYDTLGDIPLSISMVSV